MTSEWLNSISNSKDIVRIQFKKNIQFKIILGQFNSIKYSIQNYSGTIQFNRKNKMRFCAFLGHFWSFRGVFGRFWFISGHFGAFWIILVRFWVILGHFWPFWDNQNLVSQIYSIQKLFKTFFSEIFNSKSYSFSDLWRNSIQKYYSKLDFFLDSIQKNY